MAGRYMCTILDDMRSCDKSKNYAALVGLIEEAQFTANRMESALNDKRDWFNFYQYAAEMKDELVGLYEIYLTKCKELDITPKERAAWFDRSGKFTALEAKTREFFFKENKPKEEEDKITETSEEAIPAAE